MRARVGGLVLVVLVAAAAAAALAFYGLPWVGHAAPVSFSPGSPSSTPSWTGAP